MRPTGSWLTTPDWPNGRCKWRRPRGRPPRPRPRHHVVRGDARRELADPGGRGGEALGEGVVAAQQAGEAAGVQAQRMPGLEQGPRPAARLGEAHHLAPAGQ